MEFAYFKEKIFIVLYKVALAYYFKNKYKIT